LTTELKQLVDELSGLKSDLEQKQSELSDQHDETNQLLRLSTAQQSALNGALVEQASLLTETKGREAAYQQLLADNKKLAAEIKSRLYELLGVGTQINFGQAVSIASWVEKQTGVPQAFLLAILTQESNLGKNVGTCNRPGDPPEKSWKVIMKPTRDQGPFQEITKALGRNPDITPVSCPMKGKDGKQIGWGGAMGPAQFIPSTWMGYKDKVAAITGKPQADPWDIRDAFIAAALLLKNNGADNTKDGQWKAAMRYFSGGTNPAYRFYGDNVLATTAKYEQDIKDLGQ
jgi:membrane-bound lytic murein transglycosylase B